MKAWLEGLERRERMILIAGMICLVVLGGYLFVWEPVHSSVEELSVQNKAQRATLSWMKQSATEVQRLRKTAKQAGILPAGQSLLSLVDSSSKSGRLGNMVKRIEPRGDNGVQIRLEEAPFNTVITWLNSLQQKYGIVTTAASVERIDKPGAINARLTLESAPQ